MKMPTLVEDTWINEQAVTYPASDLEDCAIAVDATYYLQLFLDTRPFHEPLLPALGGVTGIQKHIEDDLDLWLQNKVTPFFIFDGQPITGQDEVTLTRSRRANEKTDQAWNIYFGGQAEDAVTAFGANGGAFRPQKLYPMLQSLLKKRKLHFLVPPFNAAAQIAYFDSTDSDQCAGIMGSQELLLYPIKDCVIRSVDWEAKTVSAISKNHIVKALGVTKPMFTDAYLMSGTFFLPAFPPLQDHNLIKTQPHSIMDAVNVLRAHDKSVAVASNSFNDILQIQDPNWLDKFRKARMAVEHFVFIAESGEVQVNEYEKLTKDNHEYLGLQLPSEWYHYLNTGMVGPRLLGYITHGQLIFLPSLDGYASEEYKNLVKAHLIPIKEQTFALVTPRLNRGIHFKSITLKVWFDRSFTYTINLRSLPPPSPAALGWDLTKGVPKRVNDLKFVHGCIASELFAAKDSEFAKSSVNTQKVRGIESSDIIVSTVIFRFLHMRGYINDDHGLTPWGEALSVAMLNLQQNLWDAVSNLTELFEELLVAFELIRFGLLNRKNQHSELGGLPMNGSQEDKDSLLLVSRCATLLKLRHEANGYTGPLSKNLLSFRSAISEVRAADRDLTEAILASMFLSGQIKRDRDDYWDIGNRLPFVRDPDVALGIAVKTYLDEVVAGEPESVRNERLATFPQKFVPFAVNLQEDMKIAFQFFEAINAGVQTLKDEQLSAADRQEWQVAHDYLELRK